MTAYYNEFDPGAAAWLRELIKEGHIADGEVDERSILDVRPDELSGFTQCHFFAGIGGWSLALRLAGWPDSRPVWTGSPPCQPFSAAGQRAGRDDARHLAPHFLDLVRSCRPGVLFGEQVASSEVFGKAAATSRGNASSPPQWAWLDDVSDRLEAARYAVGAVDFPSAGVGAPHIRQRAYFVGLAHERLGNAEQLGARRNAGTSIEAQGGASVRSVCHDAGSPSADDRTAPLHGFWSDADWLGCRDEKWRPIEPGTFPLDHGISSRVGLLRGYGNAINPRQAAIFIESVMEAA